MALHLNGGGLCHCQITNELDSAASPKTFRDVSHHRNRRSLNLVAQSKILGERLLVRSTINLTCQLPGTPPTLNILETRDHHKTKVCARGITSQPETRNQKRVPNSPTPPESLRLLPALVQSLRSQN